MGEFQEKEEFIDKDPNLIDIEKFGNSSPFGSGQREIENRGQKSGKKELDRKGGYAKWERDVKFHIVEALDAFGNSNVKCENPRAAQ